MSALLVIYGFSIVASAVMASGLAAIGAHVANRNQAMQTLCLSQGALLGVLLGIGLSHAGGLSGLLSNLLPLITGNVFAVVTVLGCSLLTARRTASKSTALVASFALLLAASHLVGALFPGLESHMSQRYFGDLATMPDGAAQALLALGALLLIYLRRSAPSLMRASFNEALTGDPAANSGTLRLDQFTWLTMVVVAVSVQLTGLLFTIICLFLPTTCMAFSRKPGATRHIRWSMWIAATGSMVGFVTSLAASMLPTVPTIAIVMALFGFIASQVRD